MKNKLMFALLIGLFLIGNVFALDSLGTFKQNDVVRITQVCDNAVWISASVSFPNSTVAIAPVNMTSIGGGEFYLLWNNTDTLGRYDVRGISNGCEKNFAVYFEVTPTGNTGGTDTNNYWWILILLTWGVAFIGFFGKNIWVTVFGGMGMIVFGIYVLTQGITIYQNWVTQIISYLSMGLGMFFIIYPLVEWLEEQ